MTKLCAKRTSLALALFLGGALSAFAEEARFAATLTGPESDPATGNLVLTVNDAGTAVSYVLTYTGMYPADVSVIRVSLPGERGGVATVLCGGSERQECPATSGRVTGVITAQDIRAVPSVGLAAHDLAGFVRLLQTRAGVAVVRGVDEHQTPGIAGQIGPEGD